VKFNGVLQLYISQDIAAVRSRCVATTAPAARGCRSAAAAAALPAALAQGAPYFPNSPVNSSKLHPKVFFDIVLGRRSDADGCNVHGWGAAARAPKAFRPPAYVPTEPAGPRWLIVGLDAKRGYAEGIDEPPEAQKLAPSAPQGTAAKPTCARCPGGGGAENSARRKNRSKSGCGAAHKIKPLGRPQRGGGAPTPPPPPQVRGKGRAQDPPGSRVIGEPTHRLHTTAQPYSRLRMKRYTTTSTAAGGSSPPPSSPVLPPGSMS
jgi:hypothetical protein